MNMLEVLSTAISALEHEAEESYTDEEMEEPEIAAWVQKRWEAVDVLRELQVKIEKRKAR